MTFVYDVILIIPFINFFLYSNIIFSLNVLTEDFQTHKLTFAQWKVNMENMIFSGQAAKKLMHVGPALETTVS